MKKNKRLLPFLFGVTALATLGITAVNSQVLIGTQDFSITVENAPDICEDPATVIGTTCSDGAVYAGLHNGQRLFVAPANEGAVQWKTSATYTPGTYGDDGFMNFAAIRQVGLSAHPAANACAAKGPDWFLPSVAEWQAIRANLLGASVSLSSIFATTSLHWTSESWGTGKAGTVEEDRVDTNYAFRPSDGAFFIRSRNSSANSALSHCVRHDGSRTYQDPCANGAPAVGTFCQSGAVYAGNGLFVAPNRTAAIQWKTSSTATPGTQSETDGVANTNAIAAAGLSAHPVANACRQMGEDWYLPANGEIGTLFTNFGSAPKALRHAFLVNLTSYHWTSTEVPTDVTRAKVQDPAGSTLTPYKNATAAYAVRCMFDPGEGFVPEDLTPDEFLLSAAGDLGVAETAVLIAFSPVTITGINQPVPVSVAGLGSPEFSINGGGWVTSGTVSEGDVVTVRVSSAATLNTAHSGTLTVGTRDVGYTVTTRPATDFTPDAFVFADLLNQPTDTTVTSASVTPTGYEQMIVTPPAGVLVSVSGGAFLSDPQVVNAGDSLRVRVATGAFAPRTITGDVVFTSTGGVETYRTTWTVSVIAAPADQVDAFAFNWEYFPQTYSGTLPGGIYESELIALTGGSGSRPLRVLDSSGHYNSGTLNRWPRIYGSRIYYKNTNVTITTSLTDDANAVMWSTANTNYPNIVTDVGRSIRLKFAPANQSNEAYSILCVASTCAEHIWTNSATRSDPRAAKAFDIVDVTGADLSTLYTSAPFTVSWDARTAGVRAPNIPISISGTGTPEYRINGGAWTSATGWVGAGSTVEVRLTSASTAGTDHTATLSVGTTTSAYTVRTIDDTTPDAFTVAAATGVSPDSVAVSAPFTITGVSASVPISVSGDGSPQLSLDGGVTWVSNGTVDPNGSVLVRLTSAAAYEATRNATIDVNGETSSWSVTTGAFSFAIAGKTDVLTSSVTVSDPVTLPAYLTASAISVSGDGAPEYSINGGAFTSASGTVSGGQTLRVRLTASSVKDAERVATVTIGTATAGFSVRTAPPEACETGAIGSVCSDGAVYAGTVNGNKIFVAPASETGTYQFMNANNASLSVNTQDGLQNAWAISVDTVNSYPAAQVCAARGSEWVLPSESEMGVMRGNRASMPAGTFSYTSAWYWTSTEYAGHVGYAYTSYLSGTSTSYAQKTTANRVHCIRYSRETPRPAITDPCAGSPAVGALCADGSVYAGLSNGERIFFESRASANVAWKTTATYTPGTTSTTDTVANRLAMELNGGVSVHPAQQVCASKGTSSSGSAWYLPSRSDLAVLDTVRAQGAFAQMFSSSATGYVGASTWSSTQGGTNPGYASYMQKGGSFIDTGSKTSATTASVLCMRYDAPQVYADPCAGSPSVGDLCSDGTVYAGAMDGRQLRVMPVSGTFTQKTSSTLTIGTISTDGLVNTEAMVTAGLSAHPAANACRAIGPEFYLPSIEELRVIRTGGATAGVVPANTYHWSSSELPNGSTTGSAYRTYLNTATEGTTGKATAANVLCVSNGAVRAVTDPCADPSPTAGSLCSDGTVYFGSIDGRKLFTTQADAGNFALSTSTAANPATTDFRDGRVNMAGMVGTAYPAANACRALGTGWYLPARDELALLATNANGLVLQQTFGSTGDYWSSTEYASITSRNWEVDMTGGTQGYTTKSTSLRVRCVRTN